MIGVGWHALTNGKGVERVAPFVAKRGLSARPVQQGHRAREYLSAMRRDVRHALPSYLRQGVPHF